MKGKTNKHADPVHFNDVLPAFTRDQLVWIGAISMMFNRVEFSLHDVVIAAMEFPGPPIEVISRIASIESLRELAWIAATHIGLPHAAVTTVEDTLNKQGLSYLKPYRDMIMHVRMLNSRTGVGIGPFKKGKAKYVLLTHTTLENLFTRLYCVQMELEQIAIIMDRARNIQRHVARAQRKERLEQAIQDEIALIQSYQNHRQSLPPLPELPKEPRFRTKSPPQRHA